jgi:hypothetical protein
MQVGGEEAEEGNEFNTFNTILTGLKVRLVFHIFKSNKTDYKIFGYMW